MTAVTNILMVGVGGQGIVLSSDLLAEAALAAGFDVKKSEVHGMSQRGGAVFSHVRFGDIVHSPVIPRGDAHVIFSLETMEVLRWAGHATPDAKAVYLDERILPTTTDVYPEGVAEAIDRRFSKVFAVSPQTLKDRLHTLRTSNVALVGVLSTLLDIPPDAYIDAIRRLVPRGTEEINRQAFEMGSQRTILYTGV